MLRSFKQRIETLKQLNSDITITMETININKETKEEFEKERFNLRMKERRNIFQDEFIQMLIKYWRMKK